MLSPSFKWGIFSLLDQDFQLEKRRRPQYNFGIGEALNDKINIALLLTKVTKLGGVMMAYLVSFSNGSGSIRHNNRNYAAENIHKDLTENNIIFRNEPIEVAYKKCFGEACIQNNKKQKRSDRKLSPESYLKKINAGKSGETSPKPFYESVIQIGNKTNMSIHEKSHSGAVKKAKEVLSEVVKDWEKENPNLYLFNATLHLDETTPHLHLDWIPVASGYKTGMPKRNSLEKALAQQGSIAKGKTGKRVNNRAVWQEKQLNYLVSLAQKHGLEATWEKHDIAEEKLSIGNYRKIARLAERQAKELKKEIEKSGTMKLLFGGKEKLATALSQVQLAQKNEEIYKAKLEEKLVSKVTTAIKEVENYKNKLDSQKRDLDIRAKKQIIFEKELLIGEELLTEKENQLFERETELEKNYKERMQQLQKDFNKKTAEVEKKKEELDIEKANLTKTYDKIYDEKFYQRIKGAVDYRTRDLNNQVSELKQKLTSEVNSKLAFQKKWQELAEENEQLKENKNVLESNNEELQQKSDELSKENGELKETINERNKFIITEAATIESLNNWTNQYNFKPEDESKREYFLRQHKSILGRINNQALKEKVKEIETLPKQKEKIKINIVAPRGRDSGMSL